MVISLREARTLIDQHVFPLAPEPHTLDTALDRVLRQAVCAPEDIPAFDRSAMDGYAILPGESGAELRIIGEATPGTISDLMVRPGECVRIFTGAAIPPGCGRVLPQEWVELRGELIMIDHREGPDFIRRRGEDARQGDVLLNVGVRLGPGELSLLAQIGETMPRVARRPRVAHIATGNELVAPEAVPASGQIRDSNSTLISALLRRTGAELVTQSRCGDQEDQLLGMVDTALSNGCDMLLLSGGASVGDYDFGPRVLEKLGFTIHFRQLDLRPGKPLVFATQGERVAFVIPGNPVSHFVTFHLAIRAALDRLQEAESELPVANVRLLTAIPAQRDSRETYWPAKVLMREGRPSAEALKWQSSGDLRGLVGANGLLRVVAGATPVEVGGELPCVMVG